MARSDMRDFEWDFIKKLLPNKSRGVKRVDDRRVINGILYALRTGIPWRDMPEQYGPWSTIYNRFNRWSKAGIWDMIFEAIVDSHNVDTVMVDSTSVRAHPTAAKLKKTDKRRCLGRSRGGLGTKIHASNNQDGLPLKLELTPNQANDAPPCGTLLTGLQPGQWVLADKAYDVNWIRNMIWEQGAIDVIPSKSNRKIPKEFDKVMYRQRNKIERFFGRLKASFRRIATRYEHTSANFLAMIKLACVRLWLEFYEYAAYRNNRRRMNYYELAKKGYPIGSGEVEAANKVLVTHRLKRSGQRWGRDGGQGVLSFRALLKSDRFERAWSMVVPRMERSKKQWEPVRTAANNGRQILEAA